MPAPIDWTRVQSLRDAFLAAESDAHRDENRVAAPTPWLDAEDVEVYDATLGARIGWKWHAVLAELIARGFRPPPGELVDWGCGSGIASRAVLAAWPDWRPERLRLWDRSRLALDHAARVARDEHPDLDVECFAPGNVAPGLLVVSHVLNELDAPGLDELVQLALRSAAVVWLENGSRATSRELSAVRERLTTELTVVAPCTHRAACGVLAAGNEAEWCHHFGRPPAIAFQSAHWAEFSRRLGIDLRSLTYSYLCLARNAPELSALEGTTRVLGRPHVQKGRLALHSCDAQGVRRVEFWQRDGKALFKRLQDVTNGPQVYRFEVEGERIRAGEPAAIASERS